MTRQAVRLAGYSFLILFFELTLIRYLPGYVRIVGFYINFVLIATFLGMSLGLLRSGAAKRLQWMGLPAMILLLAAVKYFSNVYVEPPDDPNHFLWSAPLAISENITRIGVLPVALAM